MRTGTLTGVLLPVSTDVATTSVANVVSHTELLNPSTALEPCLVDEVNVELEEVQNRVTEAAAGPRRLVGK